jgi:hypothetical protein
MCAMPGRNPYRPGVGTKPLHLAGREGEVKRFLSTLRSSPEIPANVRLTGLRGVGKTVLLSEFGEAARREGWTTMSLEIEARHNTDERLVKVLGSACEHAQQELSITERVRAKAGNAAKVVRGTVKVTYEELTFSLGDYETDRAGDLSKLLAETTAVATRTGYYGLVVLLDEAQMLRDETSRKGEHPLSLLIAAVSALQKKEIPIALVLCGLPTLTGNLLEARTYSERMFRGEIIDSLAGAAAREAFVEPLADSGVTADDDLVGAVLESVEGYPYFIQLWGAQLWDAADHADVHHFTRDLLDEVEPEIFRRLDIDFYEPRIVSLTPAEQDLLLATGTCNYPPLVTADMNTVSPKTAANVNVLLGRLVKAGVIYRARKGIYEYTAPKFHDYLKRRGESAVW